MFAGDQWALESEQHQMQRLGRKSQFTVRRKQKVCNRSHVHHTAYEGAKSSS